MRLYIKIKYFFFKIILIFFRRLFLYDCEWRFFDVYFFVVICELCVVLFYFNVDFIIGLDVIKEKFKFSVENVIVIYIGNNEIFLD